MITVNKSINLAQLDEEYNGKGLVAKYDDNFNIIEIGLAQDNDGSEEELQNVINNHIAIAIPEPTIADKLASVGLSLDELKAAILGGN